MFNKYVCAYSNKISIATLYIADTILINYNIFYKVQVFIN